MALVLDTGVIVAALDGRDPDHERCVDLLSETDEALIVPNPVVVEVDYWLSKRANVETWVRFCREVQDGAYALFPLDTETLLAAAQLQERYGDLGLGVVDASVFLVCQELGERKVATLDRRHFSVLRTAGGEVLQILPV